MAPRRRGFPGRSTKSIRRRIDDRLERSGGYRIVARGRRCVATSRCRNSLHRRGWSVLSTRENRLLRSRGPETLSRRRSLPSHGRSLRHPSGDLIGRRLGRHIALPLCRYRAGIHPRACRRAASRGEWCRAWIHIGSCPSVADLDAHITEGFDIERGIAEPPHTTMRRLRQFQIAGGHCG